MYSVVWSVFLLKFISAQDADNVSLKTKVHSLMQVQPNNYNYMNHFLDAN